MSILENNTQFDEKEICMLAKRENNNKRGYLLVNPLQGKHIPVSPQKSLSVFRQLGDLVKSDCKEEKILVIGFAETATAIGAAVAQTIGGASFYIHTTREDLPKEYKLVDFSEEHSHATLQKLYCENWIKVFSKIDKIVFVEDEVTTGKTILNFLEALNNKNLINENTKISVASIINGMSDELIENFLNKKIELHYLVRIDHSKFEEDVMKFKISFEKDITAKRGQVDISEIHLSGFLNPRLCVPTLEYQKACSNLSGQIITRLKSDLQSFHSILILGTEECMYPAIYLGQEILMRYQSDVYVHATTRSPILPLNEAKYPLHSRWSIKSVYSPNRQTYIYNLCKYDAVIIVSDVKEGKNVGLEDLCNCLASVGNDKIFIIKWGS